MRPVKIAVLVSGSGTNLQTLIDAQANHALKGEIVLVISNRKSAFALERAKNTGIKALHLSRKSFESDQAFDSFLLKTLQNHAIELIVLAGYLRILSPELTRAYPNRIINIHPSLLPDFGGEGFYGMHVHQAVHASGARKSGATVHFVNEGIDTGPIILQKEIPLEPNWTPEDIQAAVLKIEHQLLPKAVSLICEQIIQSTKNQNLSRGNK